MIYPHIPYSHRELFCRKCCQDATEAPTHSSPKSWQLPWGISPCRHGSSSPPRYQTFHSSVQGCRGRRTAVSGGSSHLHLCKQSPVPLESSLLSPANSWLQVVKTQPSGAISLGSALPAAPQPLGCPREACHQTQVTWKSRTERLFHHPLGSEEQAHLSLPLKPIISHHRCHFYSSPAKKKTSWWTQQPSLIMVFLLPSPNSAPPRALPDDPVMQSKSQEQPATH